MRPAFHTLLLPGLVLGLALVITQDSASAEMPAAKAELRICFVPLGKYDKGLLESARRGAEYLYGAQTSILSKHKLPKAAYYKPRRRYRAEKILDYLSAEVAPGSSCDVVLGFTSKDISTTKGKHVDWGILGLAEIAGTVGVVSSFRMKRRANRSKQRRRAISTSNHEIGHVLGAPHGGAPGCLMNDAQGTIRTIDAEHGLLCPESREIIEAHTGRPLPTIEKFDWSLLLGPST